MQFQYDIIVVGAGHAGCEAATAAANMGSRTLLITMDMTKIASMSCNPAMGGIAKGQIVREIDALGGFSGIVTDRSMIQFRMLNKSKGPAMWSPRAQCDRTLFSLEWRAVLENTPNLDLWQDEVTGLVINHNRVEGVVTRLKIQFGARAVILTNGTFLNGVMYIGQQQLSGGRAGETASSGLTAQLVALGFASERMKTGTPARIDGRSINFSVLQAQPGDEHPGKFSFLGKTSPLSQQRPCHITYTNERTHEILSKGFEDSPLFDGTIKGIGPRYCPSIETKIVTFSDKTQHQLFLEPEGWNTTEYYLNGFSSSLPWQVQYEAIRSIPGLENARLFRPGYAIEYDYFPPVQLYHTLETRAVSNLYFAGQINGTTGYEEAGAQGLMAGVNAHLKLNERDAFVLGRDEAYIGVLIDDLVIKGVDEPYRMFTSRAEYRILLRQDNADARLTDRGFQLGLVSEDRHAAFVSKYEAIHRLGDFISGFSIKPRFINDFLESHDTSPLSQGTKLGSVLLRPQVSLSDLIQHIEPVGRFVETNNLGADDIVEGAEIMIKYEGYIERERQMAEKMKRLESINIPGSFDYDRLTGLSTEARQKLNRVRPSNIGVASRISGVSPSDISVLLIHLGR